MSVDHRRVKQWVMTAAPSNVQHDHAHTDDHASVRVGSIQSLCPLSQLLDWNIDVPLVYSYDPISQQEVVGMGACETIEVHDTDMFAQLKRRLKDMRSAHLKWYGMFTFDPSVTQTGIWQSMPQAVWFIPKLLLTRTNANEIQLVCVDNEGLGIEAIKAEVKAWLEEQNTEYSAPLTTDTVDTQMGTASQDSGDEHDVIHDERAFSQMVNQALERIHENKFSKVVLARQSRETVKRPLAEVVSRLSTTYPQSHVFACHWRGRWLLGASPEQLVRARQGVIQVDCLAGSTRRGDSHAEDAEIAAQLLSSVKDRAEHHAVVRFVTDRLKSVADEITFQPVPVVKQLANVQHLHTPVSGVLKVNRTIVDTVELLHPTPAVGGVPRQDALAFIRDNEGWNRGFYAGGFGFVDAEGDGLFSVALRTAGVRYPEARLYAGCGIVDGSVGSDEWRETELKLQPMRMALT